ncbi:hemicentin-1-like isoform X2 [Haliotis rubra]|uniref:hemicentin-1-like isoform X2 n=1 Tax=Haliotis rubra TaxID=36100 RepID=UPI001EE55092|nr:hemicentin-1-like isoform X2 [Haliotis rubra]
MCNKMGTDWTLIVTSIVVLCELIRISRGTEACGGRYTSTSGSFTSPNYPSNYTDNITCTYTVDVGSALVILSFQDFSTESGHDYVKVYNGSEVLMASLSGANVGHVLQPATSLRVVFTTDVSGSGRGFKAVWDQVADAASVTGLPPVIHMKEYSSLMIDCSTYTVIGNSSTPAYKWTYGATTVSAGSVLMRRHVHRRQGGDYTCHVTNALGSVSAAVNVDVQYAPLISGLPAVYSIAEYSSVKLDCSDYTVVGNPSWTIYRWTRRGSTLTTQSVFERGNISRRQGGEYTCIASNTVGSVRSHIAIDVQYAPSTSGPQSTYPVKESSRMRICCRRYIRQGNPSITTYTWTHAGSIVSTRDRLNMPSIRRSQAGEYTCTASNGVGSASVLVRVDVHSPPSAPTDFHAVSVTGTAVSLQWISNYNGGANQTFTLQYKLNRHSYWATWRDGIQDPGRNIQVREDIPGLTSTKGCQFKLLGSNIYGDGESVILTSTTFSSGTPETILGLGTALGACVIVIAIIVVRSFQRRQTKDKEEPGNIQMTMQMSCSQQLVQDSENGNEKLDLKPSPATEDSDTDCNTADLNNDPVYVTTL